jgi:hypothetical protein
MGKENSNTTVGMSLISISAAALAGPSSVIWMRDLKGSDTQAPDAYDVFFYAMSALTFVSLFALLALKPLERKRAAQVGAAGEDEEEDVSPTAEESKAEP